MAGPPGFTRTHTRTPHAAAFVCGLLLCAAAWAWQRTPGPGLHGPGEPAAPARPALRILSEQAVPAEPSTAVNVRWASDRSVYLARAMHGLVEVALDPALTTIRQVIPDPEHLGKSFLSFEKLAVSSSHLAVSSIINDFAFRSLASEPDGTFSIGRARVRAIGAFDLLGDQIVFLGDTVPQGLPRLDHGEALWIGTLSVNPAKDWTPIMNDRAGAPAPGLINCHTQQIGAVRFLGDGTALVVPGFQPGVLLFSAGGRLLHTWDSAAFGLDTPDCTSLTNEQRDLFASSYVPRYEFLNKYRTIEEILPLPQGPGLLIRYVAQGRVHWELKVLAGERILTYQVPITGELPYDRLHGDVRGGRIVLLRAWQGLRRGQPFRAGHLYLAELPPAGKEIGR
jgi:hypothetical protein